MDILTTVDQVRAAVRGWRQAGDSVAFVPTMGNLHDGHHSLLTEARRQAQRVIASVFVNPMQFGPAEDFAAYPRTPEQDAAVLRDAGCDVLFMPDVEQIYPDGGTQPTVVVVRGLTDILCGQFRPGHFEGVATVVAKLFGIVQPDVAVFGEKDYQQLLVIQRMTRDLAIPVRIVGAPTVRAADGLALSSRNRYLSEGERAVAPLIHRTLQSAVDLIRGAPAPALEQTVMAAEAAGADALRAAGLKVDYFAVRDADDLKPATSATRHWVVLTAARTGRARLIDNMRFGRS